MKTYNLPALNDPSISPREWVDQVFTDERYSVEFIGDSTALGSLSSATVRFMACQHIRTGYATEALRELDGTLVLVFGTHNGSMRIRPTV